MSTSATTTNPSAVPSEVDRWNGDYGRHWAETAEQHDAFLAPVADVLLAAAAPAVGETVVDIGCGCGATTLIAAAQVGEAGAVVGVDVSEAMLEVARQRAELAGAGRPTFIHADVETYSFERGAADLVISRFGTMSFPDPARAFGNIATALKPSGRLCIATWQPLVSNEWLLVPGAALREHTGPLAAPEGPGPFAQSDPDVITSTLTTAGFVDIVIEGVQLQFDCGPTAEAALELFAQSGSGRRVLESIPVGPQREAARADVRNALAGRCDPNRGVRLGGAIWLVTAATVAV